MPPKKKKSAKEVKGPSPCMANHVLDFICLNPWILAGILTWSRWSGHCCSSGAWRKEEKEFFIFFVSFLGREQL